MTKEAALAGEFGFRIESHCGRTFACQIYARGSHCLVQARWHVFNAEVLRALPNLDVQPAVTNRLCRHSNMHCGVARQCARKYLECCRIIKNASAGE